MVTLEELEDALPSPIKVLICCNPNEFRMAVRDSFTEILENHNKNYKEPIEVVARIYQDEEDEDFKWNEFRVFVGDEIVHAGKGPESCWDSMDKIDEFYNSIVSIVEVLLDTWHDKIIECQKKNEERILDYEADGYDELLYQYYYVRRDKRAFKFLKRLATRYPNSSYASTLYRLYRKGSYGWHKSSFALAEKIKGRRDREMF